MALAYAFNVFLAETQPPDISYPEWKYYVYAAGVAFIIAICIIDWVSAAKKRRLKAESAGEAKPAKRLKTPKISASSGMDDDMFQ